MPPDVPHYGVGVIGAGPFSHHLFERLSLREDLTVTAAWFGDRAKCPKMPLGCELQSQPLDVIESARTQIVYFAERASRDLVECAIQHRKPVVLTTSMGLSRDDLSHLASLAASLGTIAVLDVPRRWDDDFLNAKSVFDSGGLGKLERLRLSIHETALPGEAFPGGLLREIGFHWLDQLLAFVSAEPQVARLRRFSEPDGSVESGFLAAIDFVDGVSAVVEVQLASLLSLRTGWLLEGTTGAYRAGRRYSKTLDGEIIDEPVGVTPLSSDPFFDTLKHALAGDNAALSTLTSLAHATRVTALIELLEISS